MAVEERRDAFATYGVHVVKPTEQRVRCIIEPGGVAIYEFSSLGGETITRVNADAYDAALRQVRENPIDLQLKSVPELTPLGDQPHA